MNVCRLLVPACLGFAAITASIATAQTTGTAWVRHAPLISGTVDGSVRQMLPESVTLNGGAVVTGDLLLPGTPNVRSNGFPNYSGTLDASGSATPVNHQVTLNGNVSLRNVVRRTNAVPLSSVSAPPPPAGVRTVVISSSTQSAGDFATLRNLTLNGGVGQFAIPPGTYGDFTANGGSGFTLGIAGGTQPVVYNFQRLTLNGQTQVQVVGPVIVNLANHCEANGTLGVPTAPARLILNVYSGGFTVDGGGNVYGFVNAPSGVVTVRGNSQLIGGVTCDELTVLGGGLLRLQVAQPTNQPPIAFAQTISTNEDTATPITLTGSDPDGNALSFTHTPPSHGSISGTAPNLIYTPAPNFFGSDVFTFKVSDGTFNSADATVSITVRPSNDAPVADAKTIPAFDEDTSVTVILTGSDVESSPLTFIVTVAPQHGKLTGEPPNLTFTPAPNYFGPDQFSYIAWDGTASSAPAMVAFTILPVNDAPVANAITRSGAENTDLTLTLTGSDIDNDSLTYTHTQPAHGTRDRHGAESRLSVQPEFQRNRYVQFQSP
jgi:hypothetical protein